MDANTLHKAQQLDSRITYMHRIKCAAYNSHMGNITLNYDGANLFDYLSDDTKSKIFQLICDDVNQSIKTLKKEFDDL